MGNYGGKLPEQSLVFQASFGSNKSWNYLIRNNFPFNFCVLGLDLKCKLCKGDGKKHDLQNIFQLITLEKNRIDKIFRRFFIFRLIYEKMYYAKFLKHLFFERYERSLFSDSQRWKKKGFCYKYHLPIF